MALTVRNHPTAIAFALVAAYNALKRELAENSTTMPHADISSRPTGSDYTAPASTPDIVTSGVASNLAGVIAIANEAAAIVARHFVDDVAHKAADTTNEVTAPTATNQATANARLNDLKAVLNTHFIESGVHFTNDTTNTIAAADASDVASSITLANAIRTALSAHVRFALSAPSINLVPA